MNRYKLTKVAPPQLTLADAPSQAKKVKPENTATMNTGPALHPAMQFYPGYNRYYQPMPLPFIYPPPYTQAVAGSSRSTSQDIPSSDPPDIEDISLLLSLTNWLRNLDASEETLCAQARNATASKTLITPTPNTTHTNPQVRGGF